MALELNDCIVRYIGNISVNPTNFNQRSLSIFGVQNVQVSLLSDDPFFIFSCGPSSLSIPAAKRRGG